MKQTFEVYCKILGNALEIHSGVGMQTLNLAAAFPTAGRMSELHGVSGILTLEVDVPYVHKPVHVQYEKAGPHILDHWLIVDAYDDVVATCVHAGQANELADAFNKE